MRGFLYILVIVKANKENLVILFQKKRNKRKGKEKTHMNIHLYEDLKIYRILLKLVALITPRSKKGDIINFSCIHLFII